MRLWDPFSTPKLFLAPQFLGPEEVRHEDASWQARCSFGWSVRHQEAIRPFLFFPASDDFGKKEKKLKSENFMHIQG
jgi:hypothetical protein